LREAGVGEGNDESSQEITARMIKVLVSVGALIDMPAAVYRCHFLEKLEIMSEQTTNYWEKIEGCLFSVFFIPKKRVLKNSLKSVFKG
jgi:hypothetical protein